MRAPCPQCQGKGALGTLGPCAAGDEHWKERCPNCDGRHTTLNMMPCLACQAKGGMGTSGPCGLYDPHFKSRCGACKGRGYSALLGQPPPGFGAQPVMAQPVMAQAVAAPAPSPAVSHRPLLVRSVRWNCTTNGHTWLTRHFVAHTLCVSSFDQGAGQTLAAFLESVRLSEFGPALAGLGATTVQDLKDMTSGDYDSIGMKKLQVNRLQAALQ